MPASFDDVDEFLDTFGSLIEAHGWFAGAVVASLYSQWLTPSFVRYAERADKTVEKYTHALELVWRSLEHGTLLVAEEDTENVSGLFVAPSEDGLPHFSATPPYEYQIGGEDDDFCGETSTEVLAHTMRTLIHKDTRQACLAVDKTLGAIVERRKHLAHASPFDVNGGEVSMDKFRQMNDQILYHSDTMVGVVRATLNAIGAVSGGSISVAQRRSLFSQFPASLD